MPVAVALAVAVEDDEDDKAVVSLLAAVVAPLAAEALGDCVAPDAAPNSLLALLAVLLRRLVASSFLTSPALLEVMACSGLAMNAMDGGRWLFASGESSSGTGLAGPLEVADDVDMSETELRLPLTDGGRGPACTSRFPANASSEVVTAQRNAVPTAQPAGAVSWIHRCASARP